MKSLYILTIIAVAAICNAGCKKLIEVDTPANQLTTDKVFADSVSAEAALTNAYAFLNVSIDGTYNKYSALYTDDLTYLNSDQTTTEISQSKISVANSLNLILWRNLYNEVYNCNDIIGQLQNSVLPDKTKLRFVNEAKFLRAYSYFYLLNFFENVPLLLSTNVNANMQAKQTNKKDVYNQIIIDLNDARQGLSATYRGTGKVRANKWAATALLAKAYLFSADYANAAQAATEVLSSNLYTPLQAPGTVFLANSAETILSIYTINGFINDASSLLTTSGAPAYPVTNSLLNTFEAGDLRQTNWLKSITANGTTYYYPYKYHNTVANAGSPEYLVVLRAAEIYLIRAEARARLNATSDAIADVNIIRKRAGLNLLPASLSQADCLTSILHEEQAELFVENGSRFLYLKNSGKMDAVLSAVKPSWTPTAKIWPIPQMEITYDSNLIQNPGY